MLYWLLNHLLYKAFPWNLVKENQLMFKNTSEVKILYKEDVDCFFSSRHCATSAHECSGLIRHYNLAELLAIDYEVVLGLPSIECQYCCLLYCLTTICIVKLKYICQHLHTKKQLLTNFVKLFSLL